jgi:hypothetical protein
MKNCLLLQSVIKKGPRKPKGIAPSVHGGADIPE